MNTEKANTVKDDMKPMQIDIVENNKLDELD